MLIFFLLAVNLWAQPSGGWDDSGTNGTTGYNDWGSGVIQLIDAASSGCAGAAVHETSDTYDACSSDIFHKCYEVFFGCAAGSDDIGSDTKGDGVAFSFSSCAYDINNGSACGGGLGYYGACANMITIEFDTWSSQGTAGFDGSYGGGGSGDHDEVALHFDGNASDAGRITSVDAGNLEDGNGHWICITYDPSTNIISASIDGSTVLSYDLTGSSYDLPTYFGCVALNQTWSSGKFGATAPTTVSDGADISDAVGSSLGCSVLPIDLIQFSVGCSKSNDNQILFEWSTASEINNDFFTVEQSIDGQIFNELTKVKGSGNSNHQLFYDTEFSFDPQQTSPVYYRLKQTDYDGAYSYSNIVSFNGCNKEFYARVLNNGNSEGKNIMVYINGDDNLSLSLFLFDVTGRLIERRNGVRANNNFIEFTNVASGMYLLQIEGSSTSVHTEKVIVK